MTTAQPATTIASRIAAIRDGIARACECAGRDPASVTLLGASKQQPIESIAAACAAGLEDFGENWAQELVPKAEAAAALGLHPRWHFIGHLQRNKVREVLPHIGTLHSLDSERLARELERQLAARATAGQATAPLRCYIEVNVAGEASKDGIAPADLPALLAVVRDCPHLEAAGLMTVPPHEPDHEALRPYFRALRALAEQHGLPGLSMGMSDDFPVAIEEGSTIIRVGTALFGPRPQA